MNACTCRAGVLVFTVCVRYFMCVRACMRACVRVVCMCVWGGVHGLGTGMLYMYRYVHTLSRGVRV